MANETKEKNETRPYRRLPPEGGEAMVSQGGFAARREFN